MIYWRGRTRLGQQAGSIRMMKAQGVIQALSTHSSSSSSSSSSRRQRVLELMHHQMWTRRMCLKHP